MPGLNPNLLEAEKPWFIGSDTQRQFTIYDTDATDETVLSGAAGVEDITGWTLSYILKRSLNDPDSRAVFPPKTTVSGIALTTPGAGLCTVTIEDTDTDRLPPGEYVEELKRTGAGVETVLVQKPVTLYQGAHRS